MSSMFGTKYSRIKYYNMQVNVKNFVRYELFYNQNFYDFYHRCRQLCKIFKVISFFAHDDLILYNKSRHSFLQKKKKSLVLMMSAKYNNKCNITLYISIIVRTVYFSFN